MAECLNDLAGALARAGRGDEAAAPLDEAEKIQQALKNESFLAPILNTRVMLPFTAATSRVPSRFYRSALRLASRSRDRRSALLSKVNVARVAVAEGRFQEAMRSLQTLLNPKGVVAANLSLQIDLAMAQAAIGMKDYTRANHVLEQELARRSGPEYASTWQESITCWELQQG